MVAAHKKQSTTRKVLKGGASILSLRLSSNFISFFTTVILITHLGIFDYGLLILIISVFKISETFLDFGLTPVVSVEIARGLARKKLAEVKRLIKDYALLEVVMGAILCMGLFLTSTLLLSNYNSRVVDLVKLVGLLVLLKGFQNIFTGVFQGHSKFMNYALISLIESFSRLILVFLLIGFLKGNVVDAMLAYVLSFLTSIIIITPLFLNTISPLRKIKSLKGPSILKGIIFAHGKYVILRQIVKKVSGNLPVWIVQLLIGVESVAIYAVANKLYILIRESLSSLEAVLMPTMAEELERDKKRYSLIFHKSIKLAFFIAVPITILTILLAPFIFDVLGFDEYTESIPILQVLSVILILIAMGVSQRSAFYSMRAQKQWFYIIFITLGTTIFFGFLLVPLYGPLGMAVGRFLSVLITIIITFIVLARLSKDLAFNPRDFFRLDRYDRIFFQKVKRRLKM